MSTTTGYRLAYQLTDGVSTLLEWDAKVPEFSVLQAEVLKARSYTQAEAGSSDLPAADVSLTAADAAPVSNPLHVIGPQVGQRE